MADESLPCKPAVTRVSLTKARADLSALVERVAAGYECFIIEKDGRPAAVLIDIDEFEDYLELNDPKVSAAIAEGREEYLAGKSRPRRGVAARARGGRGAGATAGERRTLVSVRYGRTLQRPHHAALRSAREGARSAPPGV